MRDIRKGVAGVGPFMYKITFGQLKIIWAVGVVAIVAFWIQASNYSSTEFEYFLTGLVLAGLLVFYTLGWRNANPEEKSAETEKENLARREHKISELSEEQKKYVESWSWGAAGIGFFWAFGNHLGRYTIPFLLLYIYESIISRAITAWTLEIYTMAVLIPFVILISLYGKHGRWVAWRN